LRRHGLYGKFHREDFLEILRGICPVCGVTHALIPSFSLPGSSHDTDDVERYLAGRAEGLTRREAGAQFLTAGREVRVLKRIERSFERCIRNWSAVFAVEIPVKQAYETIAAVVGVKATATGKLTGVLRAANQHALGRGVNAVFASRSSILLFRSGNAGLGIPHKTASSRNVLVAPDSS
jgi:hypothetical protein